MNTDMSQGANQPHLDDCVHRLFERQVERTPHAAAVICEDSVLSFCALKVHANRLAHELRPLREAFSTNGLDEQTPWMSPRGFHVKAKPTQQLAASIRP